MRNRGTILGRLRGLALSMVLVAAVGVMPALAQDPYAVEPQPLTVAQCGQCHISYFRYLKNEGGRHKFDCQDCHQKFHAYSPRKNNWDELMPLCSNCHTLPHGEKQTECLACHANPHTPRKVVMDERLKSACADCHASPAAQLAQFPSAHTEQGCDACHDSHGFIPSCFNCHEPHYQGQILESCVGCHPVHKPKVIAYTTGADMQTCGSCHGAVYATLTGSPSKHAQVHCAACHESHGQVPSCSDCHGRPHSEALLAKFPNCLDCHLDAHNPPIKTK